MTALDSCRHDATSRWKLDILLLGLERIQQRCQHLKRRRLLRSRGAFRRLRKAVIYTTSLYLVDEILKEVHYGRGFETSAWNEAQNQTHLTAIDSLLQASHHAVRLIRDCSKNCEPFVLFEFLPQNLAVLLHCVPFREHSRVFPKY